MPEKDWRTDNWGGHKPMSYNQNDPNMHFPRSTKEVGWGWYRSSDDVTEVPEPAFLDRKVSIGAVITFFLAIFVIGIWLTDIRDFANAIGSAVNTIWEGWDQIPTDLK